MSKIAIVQAAAEKTIAAESARTGQLLRRAEKLAAGIIIVTGFQLLDAKSLLESSAELARISGYLSLGVLSVALFFAICAMCVKGYADYPRGNKLWDNLKPEQVSEDAAQEALVQLLLQSREQNALLNDAKAASLFWCAWLFFAGCLLVAGSQLLDALAYTLAM